MLTPSSDPFVAQAELALYTGTVAPPQEIRTLIQQAAALTEIQQ